MWKVLGEETVIPMMGDVWAQRMVELSKRRKDKERFIRTLAGVEVRYVFDGVREVNTFIINLPSKYGKDDLEFMRAFVAKVNKSIKVPVVEYEGTEQRFSIIFTSDVEEDDYSWRKSHRRDYYDWVEEQARKEKEEKEKQSF